MHRRFDPVPQVNSANIGIRRDVKQNKTEVNPQQMELYKYQNKHCLLITAMKPEWNDANLIPELIAHVLKHTKKEVVDVQPKSNECIMAFNTKNDCQFVMNTLENITFRGIMLKFKVIDNYHFLQHQMNDIKREIENVLSPKLSQINKVIAAFESNPTLIESTETKMHFVQIQQKQNNILEQINRNQTLFHELKKRKWEMMIENLKRIILCDIVEFGQGLDVLTEIMNIIAQTSCIQQMEQIIHIILEYGIINTMNEFIVDQCVDLCTNISRECGKMEIESLEYECSEWMKKEEDISRTVIEIIVNETRSLFVEYKKKRYNDKERFCGVMVLVAQLYNVGLFKINLVFKGVLNMMINNVSNIEMEGICKLLIKCIKSLDEEDKLSVNKYLEILSKQNEKHVLLDQVKRMRLETDSKQRYIELESKYQELMIKYDEMNNNHKILQSKYNEIQQKYTENIKKANYKLWNAKDITNWIVDIDHKRYNKYYDILLQNMSNECIDGLCLQNMDKNDLHRLGITQFKDRFEIYCHIQDFIKTIKNNVHIKNCAICNDNISLFVCVPCGHLYLCIKCKDYYSSGLCMICKNKYRSLQPIYP